MEPNQEHSLLVNSEAPKVGPLNPITSVILAFIITLILAGFVLALYGEFLGWVLAITGGLMLVFGIRKLSTDTPRQAGYLTIWGFPILTQHPIGGNVILLPYFPFYLDIVVVDIDNANVAFPFEVMSEDDVPLEIKVELTARPDTSDLLDYVQAGGNMKSVFDQIETIAYREVQKVVRKVKDALNVIKEGEQISNQLTKNICELLESHSFGIVPVKIQVKATLPDDIRKSLFKVKEEVFERKAENMEYETMRMAAYDLQVEVAKQVDPSIGKMDKEAKLKRVSELVDQHLLPDLEHYLDEIKTLRLIKDGMVARIEGSGDASTVNLVGTNLSFGKKTK